MNKVFIDGNLWLYAFIEGQDADKHKKANKLLQITDNEIVMSSQVISEVSVNLLRKAKIEEAILKETVTNFYQKYQVISLEEAHFLSASDLRVRYRLSYWDSLILSVALQEGCTILYSEDLNNQQKIENLTIVNPLV